MALSFLFKTVMSICKKKRGKKRAHVYRLSFGSLSIIIRHLPYLLPPCQRRQHLFAFLDILGALREGLKDGSLCCICHLGRAAADAEDAIVQYGSLQTPCLFAQPVLDVDLGPLIPRKGEKHVEMPIANGSVPFVMEEVVGIAVSVAEEEVHGSPRGVGQALMDESSDGGEAGASGDGDQGTLGVLRAVDGGEDRLVGDGQRGARREVLQMAGAEALARFAEDRAVLDQGDEELDAGDVLVCRVVQLHAAVGDAKVPATDEGEDVEDALGWELDRRELFKDLEDGPPRPRGVVKVLVEILGHGEL